MSGPCADNGAPEGADVLLRTLVEEPGFLKSAEEMFGSAQRVDEALKGATFVIARDPAGFEVHVPNTRLRAVRVAGARVPDALLLYSYEGEEVHLHRIIPADPLDPSEDQ